MAATVALLIAVAPTTATAQDTDSIIVVDQGAGAVLVVVDEATSIALATDLVNPRGVALAAGGSLLVVAEAGENPGEGRLIAITPDGGSEVLAEGLNFPEGVAALDQQAVLFTTIGDQSVWEVDLLTGQVELLVQLESAPTGLVIIDDGPAGEPFLGVSTWNGLGLLFDFQSGEFQPFTGILGGGGHPDFHPDLGMCIPEFEQSHVSCWPAEGGQPTLIEGIEAPVGVAVLPSGLLAISHRGGVSVVDAVTGTVLDTLPFENPAAMVVPEGQAEIWVPFPPADDTEAAPSEPADSASATEEPNSDTDADPSTDDTAADESTESPDTAASADDPTAGGTAESDDGGGNLGLWLVLAAFLVALAGLLVWLARSRQRSERSDDESFDETSIRYGATDFTEDRPAFDGKPADMAPPPSATEPDPSPPVGAENDPCQELCDAAAKAQREADAATAAAETAETAAAEAEREAATAEGEVSDGEGKAEAADKAAKDAARAHDNAKNPPEHSGGYAASGDREYTGADHDRVESERSRIDDEVAAGDKTQQEAQAEKAELRDSEKWKELREKEEADQVDRVEQARIKAEQADNDKQKADADAEIARNAADDAATGARDLRQEADDAKQKADDARRDAEAKKKACDECRSKAAVTAAGGPDSWITRQAGVGEPCGEDANAKTVERTETFLELDESREIEVEDKSIRPQRISSEELDGIRRVFTGIGAFLGLVSKVPVMPVVAKIPMGYLGFVSHGAAHIIDELENAVTNSRRKGGLSDYYFVKITVPRRKVTVTCTCTIECQKGVWTCTGCVSAEKVFNGDLVKESEGTRAEVEQFIAGMQAQASRARVARDEKVAYVADCKCG